MKISTYNMKIENLIGKTFVFQLKLNDYNESGSHDEKTCREGKKKKPTITRRKDKNSDIGIHIVSKQSSKSL